VTVTVNYPETAKPPHDGWEEILSTSATIIRNAGLEGTALVVIRTKAYGIIRDVAFAPYWAKLIAESKADARWKKSALLKLQDASDERVRFEVLASLVDPKEIEGLAYNFTAAFGQRNAQTVRCGCGKMFTDTVDFTSHANKCPTMTGGSR
jgi:hypothetical protein